ncbi:MAG: 2Fe-2S iron-sulfur cluster binding domain-containing protein [Burkholderiales bacterium]|nr:2Fe-2S iron-sulfur cluster binding domain-containing protein [Burkholderiales bacterium]
MTYNVLLHPSHHTFLVNGADSLLEAGLRAGLAMNYGCSSGNCGLCKARVVSGQVEKIRHQDYVVSEAEKNQGYVLLCSHTAASDLVIEATEATGVNEIQLQEIDARVKEVKLLTDKVMLLHLQTPRTNRLRFMAGQSVALSIGDDASDYAIASCPCDDRNLQFNVRNIPGNPFAARVFNSVRSGDTINVYGPVGEFVLKPESTRPLLLLACNSGFAPIKSLIEHAMSLERAESLHLYWLATVQGGHYLSNWCRAWGDALDNFYYHELNADSLQEPNLDRVLARVTADHPNLSQFDVYVAGPSSFVNKMHTALLQNGVPAAQLVSAVI